MDLLKKPITNLTPTDKIKQLEDMRQFNRMRRLGPFGRKVAIGTIVFLAAATVAFSICTFSKKHEPKKEEIILLQNDTFDIRKYADARSMWLYDKMGPVAKKDFENYLRVKEGYPPLKYYVPEVAKFLEDNGFLSNEWTPKEINRELPSRENFYGYIPEDVLAQALFFARQQKTTSQ